MTKENAAPIVVSGVGLPTILFVVFLVLKLTGHIAWSWWWVTAPLWIPWAVCGIVLAGFILVVLIILLIAGIIKACCS